MIGTKSSLCIYVSGETRGDELNGIEILWQAFHNIGFTKLKGRIIVVL